MAALNQVGGNSNSSAKVSDVNAVITALNTLEARVTAVEAQLAQHKAALQAAFTALHPTAAGGADFALEASEGQHTLLHQWLDKLGGRATVPTEKVR